MAHQQSSSDGRIKPNPAPALVAPDATRSRTMRSVRATGNASTELKMVALLRKAGLSGWRRHLALPGKPDFAWPASRVALFVDGCFWHGCPHCAKTMPKANAEYWVRKVARNAARDRRVTRQLRKEGWSVLRVWEHSFREPQRIVKRLALTLRRREDGC